MTPPAAPPPEGDPPQPATQPHTRPEPPPTGPSRLPPPTRASDPPSTQPSARPVAPLTPPPEPPRPAVAVSGRVGGDVIAGDRNETNTAGRDIVGRDVVTNTTTNVGFGYAAVQRLLVTVGVMVFVTAACFFSGGAVLGGAAIAALNKPDTSLSAGLAAQFADMLATLQDLPPGEAATVQFTEPQISAYFAQTIAPALPLDITEGKVRLLGEDQVVVGGRAGGLGNLNFAATFDWQDTPGAPLRLSAAAVQALDLGKLPFGWVAIPTTPFQSLAGGLNDLFSGVQITAVQSLPAEVPVWNVTVVGQ
ncbi:MAG: hypothetical protein IT317_02065 [Anaerolineales bacterium]|nr:hypothetical protein [Anaerolineales bacterium]